MTVSGIYAIENIYNNKIYVGSSVNIDKRWNSHKKDLIKNRHHNIFMQRSYLKYGDECFVYFILEVLDNPSKKYRYEREQYWIDLIKPEYNIGGVCGGDTFTRNPRKEEIRKIHTENLRKSRHLTAVPRYGEENPNWRGGVATTQCVCECGNKKRYRGNKCKNCVDKTGKNNSFYGKTHTEETRKIISEKNKGRPCPTRKMVIYEGIVYSSGKLASEVLDINFQTLAYRCRKGLYGFSYLEEDADLSNYILYESLEDKTEITKCSFKKRVN